MSYKFILGSNPLHDPGKRKEYIVCIEPHTAVIEVEVGLFLALPVSVAKKIFLNKGKVYRLVILKLHPKEIKRDNGDTYPPFEAKDLQDTMLNNAWHWYKSVLDKQ